MNTLMSAGIMSLNGCISDEFLFRSAGLCGSDVKEWRVNCCERVSPATFSQMFFQFFDPGLYAAWRFVAFVYFVDCEADEAVVYYGDGGGEGVVVCGDAVGDECASCVLEFLPDDAHSVAECVGV